MRAIVVREFGKPDVMKLENVPTPTPGPSQVLVRIRAASLNHLDVWLRKGLPSVPKPRILFTRDWDRDHKAQARFLLAEMFGPILKPGDKYQQADETLDDLEMHWTVSYTCSLKGEEGSMWKTTTLLN